MNLRCGQSDIIFPQGQLYKGTRILTCSKNLPYEAVCSMHGRQSHPNKTTGSIMLMIILDL